MTGVIGQRTKAGMSDNMKVATWTLRPSPSIAITTLPTLAFSANPEKNANPMTELSHLSTSIGPAARRAEG